MSGQFGTMDTRDDRRELMILFQELGSSIPEFADEARARFLRSLFPASDNGFAETKAMITPCDPVAAYFLFTAITGVLGVPIEAAAIKLERAVRKQKTWQPHEDCQAGTEKRH